MIELTLRLCQKRMQQMQVVESIVPEKIMKPDDFNLWGEMQLSEQELIVEQAVELSKNG